MKIYDSQTAPNPRRVRIFLAEKGIAVPYEQVDIVKADNRSAEFRRKNPLGTLPVLELDDGSCIAESVAICRYFEETHPRPPLMGTEARDRALVEMWQRRIEFELFIPITQVFRNLHPFFAGRIPQVAEWGEVNRTTAEARMAWLDTVLAEREFIAGDRYTIADIIALVTTDFASRIKLAIPEDCSHLRRWHVAVSARPSAA